jgi:uncharacterized membrane protein (DUF373 family)
VVNPDKNLADKLFDKSVGIIADVLSLLMLAMLVTATCVVAYELYDALIQWEPGKIRRVAIDVFTVVVFIEVTQLFRNFRHGAGVPLTDILEVSVVLVMREFSVASLESHPEPMYLIGIASVLAALTVGWWLVRKTGRDVALGTRT